MLDGGLLVLGIQGTELTPEETAFFRKVQPAGYLLAARNFTSPSQTRELTDSLRDLSSDTPVIAIEQDGENAHPLTVFAPPMPSAAALAARGDLGKIADAGALTGDLLRLLGINLNLAPVLNPGTGWGSDPQRVIDRAGQWNRWMRKRSIAGCAKHFPADAISSQATIPELLRAEIHPFTALMPEIDAVLTANTVFLHIDARHPASLSERIVRRFLRDQLGFDKHLVLTKNPDAGAAIRAGNDLVILRNPADATEAAGAIAALPHWMAEEARDRLERFRKKKLHGPLQWSEEKWQSTCSEIETLAAEFVDLNVKSPE